MIQATELAEDLSEALRTLDTVPMRRPEPVATERIESAQPPVARDAWLSEIDSRPALCYGLTEHNLARLAAGWARTGATPPAVAGLLAEARRLWVGGAAVYDNFTAASLKALHASEQALRVRLAVPDTKRVMLGQLVQGPDVLAALGYDLYRLGWSGSSPFAFATTYPILTRPRPSRPEWLRDSWLALTIGSPSCSPAQGSPWVEGSTGRVDV